MNIKRSYLKLLVASATVGLFLANCTVKNSSDESCTEGKSKSGCLCDGNVIGRQVCDADGVYGKCDCPLGNGSAGTANNSAGKSSTAGTSGNDGGAPSSSGGKTAYTAGTNAGGVAAVTGGAGGAGGEGGAGFPDFLDCNECLDALCKTELDACLADEQCFSTAGDGSGEYEAVSTCIETARASGLVKRDAVRSCGLTFGASADPDATFPDWAPSGMAATTTDLVNCMATSSSETPNPQWANDIPNNFPASGPTPWPADSCAKLACTSAK
jgi:hypothetical protein